MKKISRIEYCAGFEPLQSGMEQDEGSRILLRTMKRIILIAEADTLGVLYAVLTAEFWLVLPQDGVGIPKRHVMLSFGKSLIFLRVSN